MMGTDGLSPFFQPRAELQQATRAVRRHEPRAAGQDFLPLPAPEMGRDLRVLERENAAEAAACGGVFGRGQLAPERFEELPGPAAELELGDVMAGRVIVDAPLLPGRPRQVAPRSQEVREIENPVPPPGRPSVDPGIIVLEDRVPGRTDRQDIIRIFPLERADVGRRQAPDRLHVPEVEAGRPAAGLVRGNHHPESEVRERTDDAVPDLGEKILDQAPLEDIDLFPPASGVQAAPLVFEGRISLPLHHGQREGLQMAILLPELLEHPQDARAFFGEPLLPEGQRQAFFRKVCALGRFELHQKLARGDAHRAEILALPAVRAQRERPSGFGHGLGHGRQQSPDPSGIDGPAEDMPAHRLKDRTDQHAAAALQAIEGFVEVVVFGQGQAAVVEDDDMDFPRPVGADDVHLFDVARPARAGDEGDVGSQPAA